MVSVMEFMLDQVPHMIIQRDEDGTVTYSNSLWREFTGMFFFLCYYYLLSNINNIIII